MLWKSWCPAPVHRVPCRDGAGQNLLDLSPRGASAWLAKSGWWCASKCGVDGHLCRVGNQSRRLGAQPSSPCICNVGPLQPFIRTVRPIWGSTSIACGTLSHSKTLVSGLRGVCVLASGLPSPVTHERELAHQNHWEACRQQAQALMQAVILYAHEHLQLAAGGRYLWLSVRQATTGPAR